MSRPLRIEFEGAWYHVMNRGSGRQDIFKTDDHRAYFLSLLSDTSERFNAEWHAYCLMGNHYHLMVRTPEANLQRIMRHLNGVYTQYYNRAEKRDGALFRGRYKAILVDEQAYWLQLSRYIHRNPLEAKMVKRLDRYRWSSYCCYIGQASHPEWLVCDYILKSLSQRQVHARYKAYVAEGVDQEITDFYARERQVPILGSESFKAELELESENVDIPHLKKVRIKPTVDQITKSVCVRLKVNEEQIWMSKRGRGVESHARGMAMYLCQHVGGMTLNEVAAEFGLKNYTSAGTNIRQFAKRLADDKKLQKALKLIKLDLTP